MSIKTEKYHIIIKRSDNDKQSVFFVFKLFLKHIIFDNFNITILYFTKQKKFVIILTKSEIKLKSDVLKIYQEDNYGE